MTIILGGPMPTITYKTVIEKAIGDFNDI